MKLKDKVAIITGASRGIGKAIAVKFCQEGATCVICSRSKERISKVAEELEKTGAKVLAVQADISKKEDVESLVDVTLHEFQRIDILVNNAGTIRDTLLIRMKDSDWEDVLNTNLTGVFLCTRAVTRQMLKQRSGSKRSGEAKRSFRIINISSIVGLTGNPGQANYAASKAGIIGFTKSVAKELGRRNITVNSVAPGYITTDMTANLSEEDKQRMFDMIPLGRLGIPEDVAEVAAFLASDSASYITGQVIQVDGGMAM